MATGATAHSVALDLSIVESALDELRAIEVSPDEVDDLTVLSLAEEWPDAMARLRDLEASASQGRLKGKHAARLASLLRCLADLAPRATSLGLWPVPMLKD